MAKTKQPRKCRNMMYVQQIDHLPNGMTVASLYDIVERKLEPKKWAGIIHDQDNKPDGTVSASQVHIMMQFENARSIDQVAKMIGDKPQYIQKWDNRPVNGFAYLIHATDGSRHLHQYSVDEVVANFDYQKMIEKAVVRYRDAKCNSNQKKIEQLLDRIAKGEITLKRAKDLLAGSEYAKISKKLEAAHSLYLERCADTLYETMKANNEVIRVHWIYGKTETGKTVLAEKMASTLGSYYKTATTRDPFQFYQAEPVIVLDEFRPDVIDYSELLAMLDPFSRSKVTISSRYYNKALSCHTFFITTPYSPMEFFKKTVSASDRRIDTPEQFFRRLTSILHMKKDTIEKIEYHDESNTFVKADEKLNRYSKGNHPQITVPHLFDEID